MQPVIVGTKPGAKPAETADYFIHDQQDIVFIADPLYFRPIAFRWNNHPAGTLNRLADKGGNPLRAQYVDFLFQQSCGRLAEFLRRQITSVAVPIRRCDVMDAGNRQVALFMHRPLPAQAGGSDGAAVVGEVAADEHFFSGFACQIPITPHQPEYGIVGFGTGVRKKNMI